MSNIDKDGDVNMDKENIAESNIIAHTERVGREIVKKTDALFGELKNGLNDVHNQLQKFRPSFQSQFNNSTLEHSSSQHRSDPTILRLEAEIQRLKDSLQVSDTKRTSLDEEVRKRDKHIKELGVSLQSCQRDRQRLNTIIIKGGAPNVGPSDDQIRAEFCDIREGIFKIARGHYQATNVQLPPLCRVTKTERQHQWLANWTLESPEIRNYRIQGAIFDLIYHLIFSRSLFGVEKELERWLENFEESMMNCGEISQVDQVEWRKRTVTAAKSFESRSTHLNALAHKTAGKIDEMLAPALTQLLSSERRARDEQLTKELRALCEKALKLSLELRSSKAIFKVIMPEPGTGNDLDWEDSTDMDLVAVIGKNNPTTYMIQVAFTVSGGLEKTTLIPGDGEEKVTLEKAQVVGSHCRD